MIPTCRARLRRTATAGVAAMEFALLMPVLIVLFVGIVDYSLAYHGQLQLSSTLAAGAEYAFNKGQNDSGSTLTSEVQTFITTLSPVPLSSVTAVYNNNDTAVGSCYCVHGSPPAYSQAQACGSTCNDGSGSTAGKYIAITGAFTYRPLFPFYNRVLQTDFSQTVTVRLK